MRKFWRFGFSAVAERCILQQKCLKKWIGSVLLRTRQYNFQAPTQTLSATVHFVTDRQMNRRRDDSMLSIANDMDIYSALTQLVGRHKGHPGGKNYCSNNIQSSVFDGDPTWPGNNFRKIFRLKNNSKEVVVLVMLAVVLLILIFLNLSSSIKPGLYLLGSRGLIPL